jgi:L-amino acid N-acyltransferase YncA
MGRCATSRGPGQPPVPLGDDNLFMRRGAATNRDDAAAAPAEEPDRISSPPSPRRREWRSAVLDATAEAERLGAVLKEWSKSAASAPTRRVRVPSVLRGALKRIARLLAGDYAIYRIFALDLQPSLRDPRDDLARAGFTVAPVACEDVAGARADVIRESARFGGPGSQAFAILRAGEIVALEWYWFGEHRRDGAFWPFGEAEAESAYIVTVPELRGQGLAQRIKEYSAIEMRKRGFRRAYAKIWHSHHASVRANQKSGFREIALVVDLYPFGESRRLRWVRRRSGVR